MMVGNIDSEQTYCPNWKKSPIRRLYFIVKGYFALTRSANRGNEPAAVPDAMNHVPFAMDEFHHVLIEIMGSARGDTHSGRVELRRQILWETTVSHQLLKAPFDAITVEGIFELPLEPADDETSSLREKKESHLKDGRDRMFSYLKTCQQDIAIHAIIVTRVLLYYAVRDAQRTGQWPKSALATVTTSVGKHVLVPGFLVKDLSKNSQSHINLVDNTWKKFKFVNLVILARTNRFEQDMDPHLRICLGNCDLNRLAACLSNLGNDSEDRFVYDMWTEPNGAHLNALLRGPDFKSATLYASRNGVITTPYLDELSAVRTKWFLNWIKVVEETDANDGNVSEQTNSLNKHLLISLGYSNYSGAKSIPF